MVRSPFTDCITQQRTIHNNNRWIHSGFLFSFSLKKILRQFCSVIGDFLAASSVWLGSSADCSSNSWIPPSFSFGFRLQRQFLELVQWLHNQREIASEGDSWIPRTSFLFSPPPSILVTFILRISRDNHNSEWTNCSERFDLLQQRRAVAFTNDWGCEISLLITFLVLNGFTERFWRFHFCLDFVENWLVKL